MASIYQNDTTSEKADIAVINPFIQYVYFDNGQPLSGGKLYFGLVGRDGRVETNRKRVYVISDDGSALAIEQPVILSQGGIPQHNGNPVILAVDGSYSLAIDDKNDVQEYFAEKVTAKTLLGYSGVIPEEVKTVSGSNQLVFNNIEATTASFYASTSTSGNEFKGQYLRKDVDYTAVDEKTINLIGTYPAGTVILGRALDPTGQTVSVTNSTKPLFIYDTKAEAIASDLSIDSSILINGGDVLADGKGGSYTVVAGGTGAEDGYSFINLDNGNQLKIKSTYQALNGYYEGVTVGAISAGKVTIDPSEGNIAKVSVSENVTNFEVLNVPASGELKLQLKLTQDATAAKTVVWSFNGVTAKAPGGTLPTFSTALGAIDEYIVKTDDGGVTWTVYTIGQGIS